uniref:Uncharacterized protein n=1 Tax=Timema tahoe TaxID=61484 RepID=A0A7R9NVT7_9NEOP|nr:unnamed protein product [Timema tahoe]
MSQFTKRPLLHSPPRSDRDPVHQHTTPSLSIQNRLLSKGIKGGEGIQQRGQYGSKMDVWYHQLLELNIETAADCDSGLAFLPPKCTTLDCYAATRRKNWNTFHTCCRLWGSPSTSKSHHPKQLTYLGFQIDTRNQSLQLTEEAPHQAGVLLKHLRKTSKKGVQRIVGYFNWLGFNLRRPQYAKARLYHKLPAFAEKLLSLPRWCKCNCPTTGGSERGLLRRYAMGHGGLRFIPLRMQDTKIHSTRGNQQSRSHRGFTHHFMGIPGGRDLIDTPRN